MSTIAAPIAPTADDREAHAALDDDGNPHRPLESVPATEARTTIKALIATARAALEAYPLLSIGVALGVGFLVGRVLASRSS